MCDAYSAASAFSSIQQGNMQAADAKSRGSYEQGMLEAQATMAQARRSGQEVEIRQNMQDQFIANAAAAAMSGFASSSFNTFNNAMEKDGRKALATSYSNTRTEVASLQSQGRMAMLNARIEASTARQTGFIQAGSTLASSLSNWKKYNTAGDKEYQGTFARKLIGNKLDDKFKESRAYKSFFSKLEA